jgi:hypothetical protein
MEHASYDEIPSFTGLLRRGLYDREPGEGRNTVLEQGMRYSACVGALNLAYSKKLDREVSVPLPFLFGEKG